MAKPAFVYVTYIKTTPEQLWQALTDPAFIRRYFDDTGPESDWTVGSPVRWKMRPDGEFRDWDQKDEPRAGGTSLFGAVTSLEPRKRFAARGPEAEDGSADTFELVIQAREGEPTVLRLLHSGFHGDNWQTNYEITSLGWDMCLHTFAQYLIYFPGQAATFIGAAGPEASANEHAWTMLLTGLGLTGEAVEGDTVRLTPDGLAPYDTTVKELCDWEHMCAVLAEAKPWWEPGTRFGYHAKTFGFLLGEIVRRATGRTLSSWLREAITVPLGIGDIDGVELVSPARRAGMAAVQFEGRDEVMGFPSTWAFGFSPQRPGGVPSQPGSTFGMVGMNGSAAYADVDRRRRSRDAQPLRHRHVGADRDRSHRRRHRHPHAAR